MQTPNLEMATGKLFAGRFEIIEELGKGGMGCVYKVFDTKIKEKVALKLLKPEISSEEQAIDRFSNELRLARKIAHPHVCRMFDLGEEKGLHYITMEYVPGEDLKTILRMTGPMSLQKALSIVRQVCLGLAEAHRLGVVHRDLKPQNIMIDRDGNAKIMDFGIARSIKTEGMTGVGMIIGTPEYMSPEQVDGAQADQRSDLYSLGIVMFEMLTGRRPFEGDSSFSIALKQKSEIPPDPAKFNPQIPKSLCRVILKCLEKNKALRFGRSQDLLAELDEIAKGMAQMVSPAKADGTSEIKKRTSVAVLPFVDLSPEKDQEYFCDGLAEELINSLIPLGNMRVASRTSAFSFKGKDLDVREIGKKLNVETILEGSVRKAGNRLRISAQLVSVADGYHLWSERYDRDLNDVFAIQEELALAIVSKLNVQLPGEEKEALARRPTDNIEAYNSYLRGRYYLYKATRGSIHRAIEHFEEAAGRSPGYAQAYAGIAEAYHLMGFIDLLPAKEAFPKAREFADKTIALDPANAEAHSVLATVMMYFDWNWEGAEKVFRRAIELNPNNALTRSQHSLLLTAVGKIDAAYEESRKANALDPLLDSAIRGLGICLLRTGQFEEARAQFQKSIDMEPGRPHSHWLLGQALILERRVDEGVAEIQKAYSLLEESTMILAGLGWAYGTAGKRNEAIKVLAELRERSKSQFVRPYFFAKIHSSLGERDAAFEWLEKAYEARDVSLPFILNDESLVNLHDDPRFRSFLKRMRLIP
jgi:serine/threonine-protein kinase